MIIVFFGKHSNDWMDTLTSITPEDFNDFVSSKHTNITEIKNIYTINNLHELGLSKVCIIPLMETHMLQLYNNKINALMPSLEHIKQFSCKKQFITYVNNNKLEMYTPKIYNSHDEITTKKLYIVKPYNLNNGTDMYIKQSIDVNKNDFVNKIVQEYIENKIEYCAHVVSKNGQIMKCITYAYTFDDMQHIKSFPKNTKNMSKIELDNKYVKQLELFFLSCKYTGISNTDFIICDEQIKVFEINPRLGGSLVRFDKCDLVEILHKMIQINTN